MEEGRCMAVRASVEDRSTSLYLGDLVSRGAVYGQRRTFVAAKLGRRGVDGDLRALRRTKNTDESYA